MPDRSIGGMTLAGGILRQMSSIVEGDAKVKFSLMAGSYDTMLAFFGLTNLNVASEDFMGLPGYASSFAFELFSDGDEMEFPRNPDEELNVRFLFKNGTDDADLTAFPLFGRTELTMRYGEFVDVLGSRAIRDVETWCSVCGSQQEFCMTGAADAGPGSTSSGSGSGLSNVEAGAIGAAVTIGVLTLFAGLMWLVMRRLQSRKMANTGAPMPGLEKIGSESSGSSSVV